MVIVGLLVSLVAYFLQRLVRTLDRIDSNVSQHTTIIATIQTKIENIHSIEAKLEKVFVDLTVLRNEHSEYKARYHKNKAIN
jgi:hypothetical protein